MADQKNILYLYDLPKDNVTSVTLAEKIKSLTKVEIQEQPQIKRDPNKPFYTAMVRINEADKFKEVVAAMKYFDMGGKPCRGLPYMKEVTAAQRTTVNKNNNLFIKGLDKGIDSKALDEKFKEILGGDHVVSAKVSINPDYTSRGYGFVCFASPELAQIALTAATTNNLGFEAFPYQPKDRRELRKSFNNVYVKNFPNNWTEEKLREVFGKYGNIKSLALMRA
jgi:polyadenylate-binding protein